MRNAITLLSSLGFGALVLAACSGDSAVSTPFGEGGAGQGGIQNVGGTSAQGGTGASVGSGGMGGAGASGGAGGAGGTLTSGVGGAGGNGSGGSAAGGSAAGGSGSGGSGSGGMGSGGMGSGGMGSGGMGTCLSCNQFITSCYTSLMCPAEGELCSASQTVFSPLKTCVCAVCSGDCQLTCTGSGADNANCTTCIANNAPGLCTSELNACANDL